ncbi:MAG: M56 family metallopeptidase [Planctomycetota bacterium]|jgi:WD40 repeat protein/beta-lactamase regulating signal transducer with metallopeptidase domain
MNLPDSLWGSLAQIPSMPAWAVLLSKATLLLAIVWLIHFTLARVNPRWRVLLWRGAVVGLGLLVFWTLGLPDVEVSVLAPEAASTMPSPSLPSVVAERAPAGLPQARLLPTEVPASVEIVPSAHQSSTDSGQNAALAVGAEPSEASMSWRAALLGIWGLGTALLLVRLAIGYLRLARVIPPTSQNAPEWVLAEVQRIAAEIACRRAVRVRSSQQFAVPFFYGLRRPILVLPERMCRPDYRSQLPGIVAHELTHLRSRDFGWNVALQMVSILLWFHPLAWRIGLAHRAACDAVCDAVSASYLGDVQVYCRTLARVALEGASSLPAAGLAMARSCDVRRRVAALQRTVFAMPLRRRSVIGCGLAALLAVTVLSSLQFALAESQPEETVAAEDGNGASFPEYAVRRYGSTGVVPQLSKTGTATTADGRLAATVGPNGSISLWDIPADRRIATLMSNTSSPFPGVHLAFSPDESKVLANGFVRLQMWDLATHRLLFETPENWRYEIVSAILSADGAVVATCHEDMMVHIWDANTGQELLVLPVPKKHGDLLELAFSPDGNLIAAGTRKGCVSVWDLDAGRQLRLIERAHPRGINALLFSPDGRQLYTGGHRSGAYETAPGVTWARHLSEITAWDLATGKRMIEFKPPEEWEGYPGLGLSDDGKQLYSLHNEKFAVWDAGTGALKQVMDRDRLGPPVGPADEFITIHGPRSRLRRYSVDSRDRLVKADKPAVPIDMALLSDDGKRLITAGIGKVHVWDAARGMLTHTLDAGFSVQAVGDLSSEGLVFAVAGLNDRQQAVIRSQVRAWERYTGALQYAARIEGRGRKLAISPDGRLLAVISHTDTDSKHDAWAVKEGSIEVLEAVTGNRVASLKVPTSREMALRFSPSSDAIASIAGSEFRLWDIKSGEARKSFELERHTRVVPPGRPMAGSSRRTQFYAAAVSPDLHWAVTTGLGDERVFVWNIEEGSKHKDLAIQGLFTTELAISPDSRLLAVSARLSQNHDDPKKNTITVWDIRQGRQLLSLEPDPKTLPNSISFSADGKYLLSASGASSVILWDLSEAHAQLE